MSAFPAEKDNIMRHGVWDFSRATAAAAVRRRDPTAVFATAHLVGGVKFWEIPEKRKVKVRCVVNGGM